MATERVTSGLPVTSGPRTPSPPTLSMRELNRATLARRHLIQRTGVGVAELTEHLVGLQAPFGPASVKDAQAWSGLTRLAAVFDDLRDRLVAFTDDTGRVLYDLPDAPRPDADTPAPVRYLYDYDNLVLSHADRRRVLTDAYLRWVDPTSMVMPRLVLVDGLTAGTWTVDCQRETAVLLVKAFHRWSRDARSDLAAEGEQLLRFLEPDRDPDVRLVDP